MNYSLLTLCLILVSHAFLPTNAKAYGHHGLLGDGSDLIGQICKETQQNEIECIRILKASPTILQTTNFVELSKTILDLGLNEGIKGQQFLEGLAKTKSVPAIAQCANFYRDQVVTPFKSALSDLNNDPLAANYEAMIVSDGLKYCESVLTAAHIVNPTISALNHKISLLSYIAFLATEKVSA